MLALMLAVAMTSISCLGRTAQQGFERTGDAIAGESISGAP